MKKYFYSLLFLMLAATQVMAQDGNSGAGLAPLPGKRDYAGPLLPKTTVGREELECYVISTAEEFEIFRQIVATGNPYANAILAENITVDEPIGAGSEQFHYRGVFDGQGYTITKRSASEGVFKNTKPGCIIRNLHVSGDFVGIENGYMGPIVDDATGTRIENCVSDATMTCLDGYVGGLVGIARGECFIENCCYIGTVAPSEHLNCLVGVNSQMVSIKSCYTAPKIAAKEGQELHYGTLSVDKMSPVETYKNNYHCAPTEDGKWQMVGKSTSKTFNEIKNGSLANSLNVGGRKGEVWYQHGDYPYPFRGEDGLEVRYYDGSYRIGPSSHSQHKYILNGICEICGATDPVVTIEPLQDSGEDKEFSGDIFVGYLRYKLDTNNKIATVKGTHHYAGDLHEGVRNRDATAVHIPETIIYNGVKYTVKYIGEKAFSNSIMEYCYIPKTVNNIADDAFNNCKDLRDLHIADGPSEAPGSGPEAGVYMGHKEKTHELFEDCPLVKVYIGRNLRWYSDGNNPDEPFEDRNKITDVFFGPRVTRVGNANYSDAREGKSYDLFNDCTGIERVYIMGDDKTLQGDNNLEFWCVDGIGKANNYYINRNITHTEHWEYSLVKTFGCLDHCKHVTYGPFVKVVTERSFKGSAADNNDYLETVDFTNAFRLEKIGAHAFDECKNLTGILDFRNTQLKEICEQGFYNADKVTEVNFGDHLQKVGSKAFYDSDHIAKIVLPGTVTEVGSEAFAKMAGLTTIMLDDGDGHIEFTGSGSAFGSDDKVTAIYQGRDYEYGGNTPFADCEENVSITIGPKVTKLNYDGLKNMEKLASISFLYSPTPLKFQSTPNEVFDNSTPSSMYIDRELRCMEANNPDGRTVKSTDWSNVMRNSVTDLSLGSHITNIPDGMFNGFVALKTLLVPTSVKSIGKKSFESCSKLETVCILGDIEIGQEAFNRCGELKYLFLNGDTVNVAENAFADCEKIEEIVTGFVSNTPGIGYDNSFTNKAYQNAHLVCAGDGEKDKIQFETSPWKYFSNANRNPRFMHDDYVYGVSPVRGEYDDASMPHDFTKGNYELVYLPFQMDSYYFGSDAKIYKICDTQDLHAFIQMQIADRQQCEDIYVDAINIDNEMILQSGFYIVKSNYEKSTLETYYNLYNQNKISVFNFDCRVTSKDISNASIAYTIDPSIQLPAYEEGGVALFICRDGVLKLVNGETMPKTGEVIFVDRCEEGKQMILSVMDNRAGNTFLSSKVDLAFNQSLEGYSTFYAADHNYVAPAWCDVYVITSAEQGKSIVMEQIQDRTITKGQAVLLKSNRGEEEIGKGITESLTYAVCGSSENDLYSRNILKGVARDTLANALSAQGFVYVLSRTTNGNTGFYKLSGDRTMPAGKAYLDPDGLSSEQLAKACLLICNDSVNAISAPYGGVGEDFIYDLMGRRLQESGYRGIVIKNGKKVKK